jgi:hypothetical protein
MREQLAHRAARIMAEDGIQDFALAKRKAARQAGVPATRHLPTNEEVEQALRSYLSLYQNAEHRARLCFLRAEAVRAMRELSRYNPHLVGSVLSGSAGRYSDINLQLFTDSVKEVELYLLQQQMEYRPGDTRLYVGDQLRTLPCFVLSGGEAVVTLTVLPANDVRCNVRRTPEGRVIERARLDGVIALLADREGQTAAHHPG